MSDEIAAWMTIDGPIYMDTMDLDQARRVIQEMARHIARIELEKDRELAAKIADLQRQREAKLAEIQSRPRPMSHLVTRMHDGSLARFPEGGGIGEFVPRSDGFRAQTVEPPKKKAWPFEMPRFGIL